MKKWALTKPSVFLQRLGQTVDTLWAQAFLLKCCYVQKKPQQRNL